MDLVAAAVRQVAQSRHSRVLALTTTVVAYLTTVRLLRYRRRNRIIRDYGYPQRPLSSMTVEEASKIRKQLTNLEFPHAFTTSLFFALFKTYAIPTISKLLLATGQLSSDRTASKRAADTAVIISEMSHNSPQSERATSGIARMNFLHSRYRKSGKITDDDMLYTLSLFALEPERWISRFEWRNFSDVELCAEGVFWRDIGEAMEIPYGALELCYDSDERDGLAWLRAIKRWSDMYEKQHAVPNETNAKVAKGTLDILLFNLPLATRGVAVQLVSALIAPNTRDAMHLPHPTKLNEQLLISFMALRRFFIKYFHLPRPSWLEFSRITDDADPETGNYHMVFYFSQPWYVKPTWWNTCGPGALFTRLLGGLVPANDAPFRPEGYKIEDLGPENLEGKGRPEMEAEMQRLRARRGGGCPMGSL
ncbi:hypothetical protein jhhlp_005034 [Lomentospora prolificans]|uniref:Uncharacterized protein n=1 Tax=Lomentospora prolificans TaxID=41688 RepID=A0A2N3N896_9PEZI|nr:hypothetical protein jhhlp_005034 [Lomentospora prolificans]